MYTIYLSHLHNVNHEFSCTVVLIDKMYSLDKCITHYLIYLNIYIWRSKMGDLPEEQHYLLSSGTLSFF